MLISSGTRLGPYDVLSVVGAGGMGEVWRARDPRLGREVAIKVLPSSFLSDPDRLRRFEQEARAAARLNHPNILTVHEIATHDNQPYVVSELLDGETMRDLLAQGPPPLKKAVDYAIQLCRGLAAAHEKGIVHRDLKPENVFVTTDGRVKILDFGLAKLTEAATAAAETALIGVPVANTSAGLVVGTIGYMSPEQVRGQLVDQRSDIFNVGTILYELLSGSRAFAGATPADTLSEILGTDPPELTIRHRSVSPALDRIIRHCLEKAPSQRFQSASDVAFALETTAITTDVPLTASPAVGFRRRWPTPVIVVATAIVSAAISAAGVWRMMTTAASPTSHGLSLTGLSRLTQEGGFSDGPVWSPNGKDFAFSSNKSGNFEIYVRQVEGGEEINITKDASDDVQPAFSPDGNEIAFVSTRSSKTRLVKRGILNGSFEFRTYGGDIWVVPKLGGRPQRIAANGNFPIWRPDEQAIAYVTGTEGHQAIMEVSTRPGAGGESKALLPGSASRWNIATLRYSPDGRWLTFESPEHGILALPASGGSPQFLVRGRSHHWAPTGQRIYFTIDEPAGGSRLLSLDIQEHSGTLSSTVSPIAVMNGLLRDVSVSPDGRRLLSSDLQESLNLTRQPLNPDGGAPSGPEEVLTSGQVRDGSPSVSPDNRRVLFTSSRVGLSELWMLDLESHRWDRIQTPRECPFVVGHPSWTPPNGFSAAFNCLTPEAAGATVSVWRVALDGSETKQLMPPKPSGVPGNNLVQFSHDGRSVLVSYLEDGFNQLFVLDADGGHGRQLTTSPSDKFEGRWSPDDRWIFFPSNAGGSLQVWKVPSQGGQEEQMTRGEERIRHLFFSLDPRWIYVQPDHLNIYRMSVEGGARREVTHFPESGLFLEEPSISPDGRFLYYSKSRGGSSVWLLTLGSQQSASQ